MTAPRTDPQLAIQHGTPRDCAEVRTDIWQRPQFQDLKMAPQLLYFALRAARTTNHAGVSPLDFQLWSSRALPPHAAGAALFDLEQAGLALLDDATNEVLVPDCIRDERVARAGYVLEFVIRDAELTRSQLLRHTIADELRALGTKRATLAGDCLDRGITTPDPRRVSLLTREELAARRRAFVSAPGRKRMRAEIDAGMHVCAHCGVAHREERNGQTQWLHADHIVSLALGGTSNYENLQPLCAACNNRKGTGV